MKKIISLQQHLQNLQNGIYQLNEEAEQYYPDFPEKRNAVVNIKYFDPSVPKIDGSVGKWFFGFRIIKNYFSE